MAAASPSDANGDLQVSDELSQAVRRGNVADVTRKLIDLGEPQEGTVNDRYSHRDTLLMDAARYNKEPLIAFILIRSGADPTLKDKSEMTALHYACRDRDAHVQIVKLLLKIPEVVSGLEHKNKFGNTALMEAVFENSHLCVSRLLGAGARFDSSLRYTSPARWQGMSVMEAARIHAHTHPEVFDVLCHPGVLMCLTCCVIQVC